MTWRPRLGDSGRVASYLAGGAISVLAIAIIATIPSLQWSLFGLVALPYLFIGMSLTTLFSQWPGQSTQLYLADLSGAGLGALLAVPLLNWLGGLNGTLAMALLLALAGLALRGRRPGRASLAALALALLLLAGNLLTGWLAVDMSRLPAEKPIAEALTGTAGAVVNSHWDAFARTDLVDPEDGGPYRLYMDGAAGSVMPPSQDNAFLWQDIGFFPFATEQPQRVFLIGPGGGLDVWFAVQSGAQEIVAVEVNPASVDMVADYADYNGDLYGRSTVKILVDDGRSVLQRDQSQYDLIFLSQVVTLAAERNGYTLVENSSYTIEAFAEFLDHLTPDGQIGVKLYDEPTLTRALSTALATFRRQGLTDQEGLQHIIALLDSSAEPPIPLLIIGKQAFSRDESLSLGAVAQQVGFRPLFLPGVTADPPLDGVFAGATSFSEVIADSDNDLSPTTDNRPFFYQFERGIPRSLQPLLWGMALVLLLGAGLLITHQRQAAGGRWAATAPFYFAGLGLGFILVEIGIIQQARLFLGHPTTAITVVLATLLISGGIGSGLAGRWFRDQQTLRWTPSLAVIVILALWLLLWPPIQDQALGAELPSRILIVMAILTPLGLAMGMPFPLGLRAVAAWGRRQVALAWAVNGVLSVAGSVLAVTLATQFGFSAVLLAGGLAYVLAAAAAALTRPTTISTAEA